MNSLPSALAAVIALACAAAAPAPAHAETRACTPVASLPATLASPGVYCFTGDLSTAMTAGAAITIASDAVTLDCNGYKLGGLAAGPDSNAIGIKTSYSVDYAVVRGCNIRGFHQGVALTGIGVRVLDNRLDGNLKFGIFVAGQHVEVRGNRVFDTAGNGNAYGISVVGSGFVGDNTVSGVVATGTFVANGISVAGGDVAVVSGNRIRGIDGDGDAFVAGVRLSAIQRASVHDNHVVGTGDGYGIFCTNVPNPLLDANGTVSFTTGVRDCAPLDE